MVQGYILIKEICVPLDGATFKDQQGCQLKSTVPEKIMMSSMPWLLKWFSTIRHSADPMENCML